MFRLACQTYTWQMLGDGWSGTARDLLTAIARAGYEGIEITEAMIGEFADRPRAFAEALRECGLAFAAFCSSFGRGFADPSVRGSDLKRFSSALRFVAPFAGTRLQLGSPAEVPGFGNRREQLLLAAAHANRLGECAAAEGVPLHIHPNSADRSLVKTAAEYEALIDALDPPCVNLCVDAGHVIRCGNDVLRLLDAVRSRVVHIHLKDVTATGEWALLGTGACPLKALLMRLREWEYPGWVVCEEESDAAADNPEKAVGDNLTYLRRMLACV